MAIDIPPPAPNRTNPVLFSARMDDFLAWMVVAIPQMNALALGGAGGMSDGTALLPGLSFANDTDTGFWRPVTNSIGVVVGGIEQVRVVASQLLLNSPNGGITGIAANAGRFVTQGTNVGTASWVQHNYFAGTGGPLIALSKSRGGVVDSMALVLNNDILGNLEFYGADGTTAQLGARIRSTATGTPIAGDVRANLSFWTTGVAAGAAALRLTIDETTAAFTLPVTSTGNFTTTAGSFITSTGIVSGGYIALANGTLALALGSRNIVSVTPTATGTITSTVPPAGTECCVIINTLGVTSWAMTFGTGFRANGVLNTGTVAALRYAVSFVSDGTVLNETGRVGPY